MRFFSNRPRLRAIEMQKQMLQMFLTTKFLLRQIILLNIAELAFHMHILCVYTHSVTVEITREFVNSIWDRAMDAKETILRSAMEFW